MGSYKQLNLVCWNSRGFNTAVPYLRKLVNENDVVAVSEHWLHQNRLSKLNEISDEIFTCGRSSKFAQADHFGTKRGQGGVALLWKRDIEGVTEISDIVHDRICGIKLITKAGGIFNIFSVYMPADGCGEDLEACLDDLVEILESRSNGETNILCGDFNADLGVSGGPRGKRAPSKRGKALFSILHEFGFIACNLQEDVTGPLSTYVGPTGESTVDYFLVPQQIQDRVNSCEVIDGDALNTSDHRPVKININIDNHRGDKHRKINADIKRWDRLDSESIRTKYTQPLERNTQELLLKLQDININESRLDSCIDELVGCIKEAAKNIPTAKFKRHLKPYCNEDLEKLKKDKVNSYNKWVTDGRPRTPDNHLWISYKSTKKAFLKELKRLGRQYEDEQVAHAVKAAEVDRGQFWKLVKKSRGSSGSRIAAIKDVNGKVVSDLDDILEVWRTHFSNLYTPKTSEDYDQEHYTLVTERVAALNAEVGDSNFLANDFEECEVLAAIKTLHKKKACGFDAVSTEHLVYGGPKIVQILTLIYNHILRLEYVPINLRRGIQIPLFKGKGTCCLETDNYRGISLLTNFNKVYEVLLWNRIREWWVGQKVTSELQGAGKKKQSCVHTALLLQESIAYTLEKHNKVFVTFLDVSKAYDTVWTDGLFYKLHGMGLTGKIWRLMYRAYINFESKVRIEDKTSEWFPMLCGIHQGGFLSLTKYVAFIDGLLRKLEDTKLCCSISKIPSTPVGYADDIASACISKLRTDRVLQIVHEYGCRWRFNFNAKKSAILVYGETRKEHENALKNRFFKLGKERVCERLEYDHVGVKACILSEDNERVSEKIKKGRRALNAASGLGIRINGITMKTCNLIFWTIVMPIITFGSEIWMVSDKDIDSLQNFQRYAGRRVQRFPKRSPSFSSHYGLGWIRIDTYVQIKKLLFILTLIRMEVDSRLRIVFKERAMQYINSNVRGGNNEHNSPIFEMLNVAARFGLLQCILEMTFGYADVKSKAEWSKLVWKRGWDLDDLFWKSTMMLHKRNDLLISTIGKTQYITWWHIADIAPQHQKMCETMARLVCRTSLLKEDDPRYRGTSSSTRNCSQCDLSTLETIAHLVMQCPANERAKEILFIEIERVDERFNERCANAPDQVFFWLMGKAIDGVEIDFMTNIWIVAGYHICNMYNRRISQREGVG